MGREEGEKEDRALPPPSGGARGAARGLADTGGRGPEAGTPAAAAKAAAAEAAAASVLGPCRSAPWCVDSSPAAA